MELTSDFQNREKRSVGKAQVFIDQLNAELIDISEGGLCFRTDKDHDSYISNIKNVTVRFEKDKDHPSDIKLVMSAKICRNVWDEQKNCYFVGLEIHEIQSKDKENLKNLIALLGESESSWELDFDFE